MLDIERALCSIYYKKCSTLDFIRILQSLRDFLAHLPSDGIGL